jgi:hypothetical protein
LSLLLLASCGHSQVAGTASAHPRQEPSQPATKLEAFLGKKGRLLIKDSYSLSPLKSMGRVEMDALVMYEPGSAEKTNNLRVEITEAGSFEHSNTSFVDLGELQGLSDALRYMTNLAAKWNG